MARQRCLLHLINIITKSADLLHLLENTFDQKRISANLSSKLKPNTNLKAQQCFWTDET